MAVRSVVTHCKGPHHLIVIRIQSKELRSVTIRASKSGQRPLPRMAFSELFRRNCFILVFLAFFHFKNNREFCAFSSIYVPRCRDPDLGGQELFPDHVRTCNFAQESLFLDSFYFLTQVS